MKTYLFAGTTAAMLVASHGHAADLPAEPQSYDPPEVRQAAPDRFWYASIHGGASIPHDLETVLQPFGDNIDLDLDTGFVIGAALGRQVSDRFRAELELSYARHEASSYTVNGGGNIVADGPIETGYLLLNGWYGFTEGGFVPYAGAGIGLGMHRSDIRLDNGMFGPGEDDIGLAFQLGAGARYALTPRLDVDLGYRFKGLLGVDFPDRSGANETYTDGDLYSHNLQIGLTYRFGN